MKLHPLPARALVLGIDPGARSGWALVGPGTRPLTLIDSGDALTADERADIVVNAGRSAASRGLPLAIVAETWATQGMTPLTYGGLREAWGRWSEQIELSGVGLSRVPVVRVLPNVWRAGLGLKARGAAAWKRQACLAVRARYGIDATPDEAEAICIATWGSHSDEVRAALERRRAA